MTQTVLFEAYDLGHWDHIENTSSPPAGED
jgi:hypothetical protein